ncbi:MAG: patatin-like phospholipase family protein [Actinomycetota bacterium]
MPQEAHDNDQRDREPVQDSDHAHPEDDRSFDADMALCLSGGGYRAMLFHLGALTRLNELGKLRHVARISGVSGGSITAGVLGLAWKDLSWDGDDIATNFEDRVTKPIIDFAGKTIDAGSIIFGLLTPGRSIGQNVRRAYDKHLFDDATLNDLPDSSADEGPRFVINATNVQTGKLYRFSRPYEADYTIGMWRNTGRLLSEAVAASSAFPPVLSPLVIKSMGEFDESTKGENAKPEFMDRISLSDGGVYDNLGLETAWRRHGTILVSDGGGVMGTETDPKRDWARHGIRVAGIVDGQVRALRKRQVIGLFGQGVREGSYWGMRGDVDGYELDDPLEISEASRDNAAHYETRLRKVPMSSRNDIVNWGYVIADTALRRWVYPDAPRPGGLPRR